MKLSVDSSVSVADKSKIERKVATDQPGIFFPVKLQEKITPEKSDVSRAKKMLIFSDIEGEFGSMRKFLQANKVIDDKFKWIFGDGQLLLVGDFVDRGKQVTEVLWLIYSLEEQA
ncbi:MAG: metallophosphoesterase, partial [bacterium]